MPIPDFASRTDIRGMVIDLSDSISRVAKTSQQLTEQQLKTFKKIESLEAQMLKQMRELHRLHEFQQSEKSAAVDDSLLHFKQEQSADIERKFHELRSMSFSQREEQIEMRQQIDKLSQQQVSVPRDEQTHGIQCQQEPPSMASVLHVADGQEHVEEQLPESMWTSVFFIGGTLLENGGSLVSMVLLLLNICIQVFFSGIIANKFTDDPFHADNVLAFEKWRKRIAHDLRHIDPITGVSLASRVCSLAQGKSLSISTEQYNAIMTIRGYLPDTDRPPFEQILSGPTMCVLALFVWFSSIIKEVQELVVLVGSISMAPTSTHMAYEIVDGQLEIRSIGFIRKLFIYFMVGVRAFILVFLCIYGTKYVVFTVSVQDLLLNCVALTFVLDIDELLCGAFAPSRLLQIIRSVLPLKRRKIPSYLGADAMSIACLSGVLTAVAVISVTMLIPLVDRISMSKDHLCSGALDFVYTSSASGRMFFSPSRTGEGGSHDGFKTYDEEFVDAVLHTEKGNYMTSDGFVTSMGQMNSISNQAIQDAFDNCEDRLEGSESYQRILRTEAQRFVIQGEIAVYYLQAGGLTAEDLLDANILRCEPLRWLCRQMGDLGLRMRMFCPRTCRCDDPVSFMVDRRVEKGCDDSCYKLAETLATKGEGHRTSCTDSDVQEVHSYPFTKELEEYKQFARAMPFTLAYKAFEFSDLFYEYGCEAVHKWQKTHNSSMCTNHVFEFALQQLCPASCGCGESWTALSLLRMCPRICATMFLREQISISVQSAREGLANTSANQQDEHQDTRTHLPNRRRP